MKKKLLALLAVAVIMVGTSGEGSASESSSFSDTEYFTSTKNNGDTVPYMEITNTHTYTHTLDDLASSDTLISASLTLHHQGNSNSGGEAWFSYGGGTIMIGQLSSSTTGNDWIKQTLNLSPEIIKLINSNDPRKLQITLSDAISTGTDKLKIDYSTISGLYTPASSVPLPGTALILCSGLAGLAGTRLRKKK